MKRILLAVVFVVPVVFANSTSANPTFERHSSWHIRTKIDAFDNTKDVTAVLWPKSGPSKRMAFVIQCVDGQVVIYLSVKRGRITGKKIAFRQHLSDSPAIFREWLAAGDSLMAIDSEEIVNTLRIGSGVTEYLVRIERNHSNETLNFELGTIDVPYRRVKNNCQK